MEIDGYLMFYTILFFVHDKTMSRSSSVYQLCV